METLYLYGNPNHLEYANEDLDVTLERSKDYFTIRKMVDVGQFVSFEIEISKLAWLKEVLNDALKFYEVK